MMIEQLAPQRYPIIRLWRQQRHPLESTSSSYHSRQSIFSKNLVVVLILIASGAIMHTTNVEGFVSVVCTTKEWFSTGRQNFQESHCSTPLHRQRPLMSQNDQHGQALKKSPATSTAMNPTIINRRSILYQFGIVLGGILVEPSTSHAGEVGARITKAVTESDIGISVRRSVVQGAQIMDKIDGRWEQFSDRYQLGSARQQEANKKPKPKTIPPLQELDGTLASNVLELGDSVFLSLVPNTVLSPQTLRKEIQTVSELVGPSFVRAGTIKSSTIERVISSSKEPITSANELNYLSYIHYKAYCNILIKNSNTINFRKFQNDFELKFGQRLIQLLVPSYDSSSVTTTGTPTKQQSLLNAVQLINDLCTILVKKGFVAQYDQSSILGDNDDGTTNLDEILIDWVDGLTDLSWTVAIDNDVTLSSQILLQEQGYRFYPNYCHAMIRSILNDQLNPYPDKITLDDYYMDTDYNSDPDKFEVKEILININIETP